MSFIFFLQSFQSFLFAQIYIKKHNIFYWSTIHFSWIFARHSGVTVTILLSFFFGGGNRDSQGLCFVYCCCWSETLTHPKDATSRSQTLGANAFQVGVLWLEPYHFALPSPAIATGSWIELFSVFPNEHRGRLFHSFGEFPALNE